MSLQRHPDDLVVSKTTCDAFYQTRLAQTLEDRNVGHLLICGWATDFCVDTTVRSAISHGYDITVASDAHTAADRPHLDAVSVITHHNQTWPGILTPGTRIEVVPTDDLVRGILDGDN